MTGLTVNLWSSTATFRQCRAEKISFVLLNQIDLLLTVLAVSSGLREINPVMNYLLAIPVLLVIVKTVIPLLIAWLVPGRLLLPAIGLLSGVILWNITELVRFLGQTM